MHGTTHGTTDVTLHVDAVGLGFYSDDGKPVTAKEIAVSKWFAEQARECKTMGALLDAGDRAESMVDCFACIQVAEDGTHDWRAMVDSPIVIAADIECTLTGRET